MIAARRVVLSIAMVGLAACGGGNSGSDGGGNMVMGTFDAQNGSPCLTQDIKGSSTDSKLNDPQCTVVENPGDGGGRVTFASCIDNNNQPPCWALTSCPTSAFTTGLSFILNFGTTQPAPSATFTYQCSIVCLIGTDGAIC